MEKNRRCFLEVGTRSVAQNPENLGPRDFNEAEPHGLGRVNWVHRRPAGWESPH